MTEETQQEFLKRVKSELGLKWDELASLVGIEPRTLISYRLPVTSKGYRGMDKFTRMAVVDAVSKKDKALKRNNK